MDSSEEVWNENLILVPALWRNKILPRRRKSNREVRRDQNCRSLSVLAAYFDGAYTRIENVPGFTLGQR